MQPFVTLAIVIALLAVIGVLGLGLFNMARGGPGNVSQRLMRLRVLLQLVALIVMMGALFFFAPR